MYKNALPDILNLIKVEALSFVCIMWDFPWGGLVNVIMLLFPYAHNSKAQCVLLLLLLLLPVTYGHSSLYLFYEEAALSGSVVKWQV